MSFLDALKKTVSAAAPAAGGSTKTFVFDAIPTTLAELQARPEAAMKDPFGVAALAVIAFNIYPLNRDIAIEMINFLKGPAELSNLDKQFIRDRFMDSDYVPRSYFQGATPANNYEPSAPYTIAVTESAHSRDQFGEGYLTLYLTSGGADSPRPITLRTKPSTGEWFLWEFRGILPGIRVPAAQNPWA